MPQGVEHSRANWERGQRAAWGESHREDDGGSDEMVLVDSTVTITNHAPAASNASRGDVSLGHDPPPAKSPSPTKAGLGNLAKSGIAAALIASGGGAAIGVPLLIDTLMKSSTSAVQPATPTPQQGSGVRFELGRDGG